MGATAASGSAYAPTVGIGTANCRTLLPCCRRTRRSWAATENVGAPEAGKVALWLTMSPTNICSSGSGP